MATTGAPTLRKGILIPFCAIGIITFLYASAAQSQNPNSIFVDSFQRADSSATGNGWTDTSVGSGRIAAGISANRQYMISNNNGQPITYRTDIAQTSGIVIKGQFSSSNLTDGYLKVGLVAAEGYRDTGYAVVFAAQIRDVQGRSLSQSVFLSDNHRTLATVPFSFNNTDKYAYEWNITPSPQNWSYLYVWNAATGSKPSAPSLTWNNSGNNYSPTVSGNRFYFTSGLQGLVQPTETMYTYLFEVDRYVPPFLSFPIGLYSPQRDCLSQICTAFTAPIVTVLDHSGTPIDPGCVGAQCKSWYKKNGKVQAYTGEIGDVSPNCSDRRTGTVSSTAGYENAMHKNFRVNGNYVGAGCEPPHETVRNPDAKFYPRFLNYDGHSGYDYGFKMHTAIVAPYAGKLFKAAKDPVNHGNCDVDGWKEWHTFYIVHGDFAGNDFRPNGYSTWYLHADRLDESIGRQIGEDTSKYVRVNKGQLIAFTGDFGKCFPVGPHLHFEVRSGLQTIVDPYSAGLWVTP
jgi:murein DD-endopeptidase MepM/ murein hydrolase activator NlpD